MRALTLFLAALTVFSLAGAQPLITEVLLNSTLLIPEGIEYHSNLGFVVSSLTFGQLQLAADDGALTQFTDYAGLSATAGLRFDNETLYATNSLFTANGTAGTTGGLAAFNLAGETLWYVDLSDVGFPGETRVINDVVAVGSDLYVTESVNGLVYLINAANQNATIWSESDLYKPLLQPPSLPIGINGIDHFGDADYLLAVRSGFGNESALIKIPFAEPANPSLVPIADGLFLEGADGARFGSNGDLYVVSNNGDNSKVFQVHSDDDFATAAIVGEGAVARNGPTSLVVLDQGSGPEVYVVTGNGFVPGNFYIIYVPITASGSSSSTGSDGDGTGTGTGTGATTDGNDGNDGNDGGDGDSDAASSLKSWII